MPLSSSDKTDKIPAAIIEINMYKIKIVDRPIGNSDFTLALRFLVTAVACLTKVAKTRVGATSGPIAVDLLLEIYKTYYQHNKI